MNDEPETKILRDKDDLVQCPYDPIHFIRDKRLIIHLFKCRENFLRQNNGVSDIDICSFDQTHHVHRTEMEEHLQNCPAKKKADAVKIRLDGNGSFSRMAPQNFQPFLTSGPFAQMKELSGRPILQMMAPGGWPVAQAEADENWDIVDNNSRKPAYNPSKSVDVEGGLCIPDVKMLKKAEKKEVYKRLMEEHQIKEKSGAYKNSGNNLADDEKSATKNFDDDFSLVDQEKKSSNFSLEAASNLRASRVVGKGRGFTAINSSNGTGQIIHDLQQSIESFSIENRNEIDFLAQAELNIQPQQSLNLQSPAGRGMIKMPNDAQNARMQNFQVPLVDPIPATSKFCTNEASSNESPQILAGMNRFLNNNPSMQTQNLEAPIFDSNPASNTKMIGASVPNGSVGRRAKGRGYKAPQ